jgi:uncharacterized protein (DUF2164 family)
MGLGYTIDTPVKVARFGISSVVSIIQDHLVEQMREWYCKQQGEAFVPIPVEDIDHRAKRITAYLDLMQRIISAQMVEMKKQPFEEGNEIVKYFRLLPEQSELKRMYLQMIGMSGKEKVRLEDQLRELIVPGSIDVNIMTKINNSNYSADNELLAPEYADAVSALRGFANSVLHSSIVFSAGLNPRLYAFLEQFPDFYPDQNGQIKKKIILKVSDYRSALIQGKFLAKKGLWISEFRIESGLNCGGHAFPTEGYLLGPILEEFKNKKNELVSELYESCSKALELKNNHNLQVQSGIRITVQGGIGTSKEDTFLREYYNLDGTGWGSPFLLVPEVTNVDSETLIQLSHAKKEDYFLSHASPLGIPFNNFKSSTSEKQRISRIEKNRPGSPCYQKFLSFNTEFTEKPICVSSREYQEKKLKQLDSLNLSPADYKQEFEAITSKDCLCEGLSSSVLIENKLPLSHKLKAVTICPGPNLAYFSTISTLEEMAGHIYGRLNLRNSLYRPHMFFNELKMYIDYLKAEIQKSRNKLTEKQFNYFSSFRTNLLDGIGYYNQLINKMTAEVEGKKKKMEEEIEALKALILDVHISEIALAG